MSEKSDDIEATARTGTGETDVDPGAEEFERAAESFLALESDVSGVSVPGTVWGTAVDVDRVPGTDVPEGYPIEIATDEALALSLDVDGRRVAVYFEWEEGRGDDRLDRLLALKGIPRDRLADLHGEGILLDVEDGHYVPRLPDELPRGSSSGFYGIVACLGLNILTAVLVAIGLGGPLGSVPVVALWLLANCLVLPASTYLDAWYLRTRTDWDGGPLFWTALAMLPGANVLSSAAYLFERGRAIPLN